MCVNAIITVNLTASQWLGIMLQLGAWHKEEKYHPYQADRCRTCRSMMKFFSDKLFSGDKKISRKRQIRKRLNQEEIDLLFYIYNSLGDNDGSFEYNALQMAVWRIDLTVQKAV